MKKTTKKISAAALALVMGATAFTGCSGSTNSTPGGTDSAASTTSGGAATGSQKKMSSNENVKSAVDNVSVAEDYKDIKVDTKLKFMAWYDIQEASPAVELFKTLYGTPKNKPEGYESVADENVFVNVKVHHTVVVCVCLIHFDRCKFGVVSCIHTLVSEDTAYFIYPVKSAYDKTL